MTGVALEAIVLSSFREFYAELLALRDEVEGDPWSASAGALPDEVAAARKARLAAIQGKLSATLQRLEVEARRIGGERAGRRISQAGYVMAALADEHFLNLDWEGRDLWAQNLLESRLYGTHMAGEQVFERAEALLRERDDREMAAIYLLALSLGFEGEHRGRGASGAEALRDLKGRLLAFVSPGGSEMESTSELFPQSYLHTLAGEPQTRLPRVATWSLILLGVMGVYLLISHLVWMNVSGAVREIADAIDWLSVDMGGDR